jgi:Short C-terminal domain
MLTSNAPTVTRNDDPLATIKRLAELRDAGALTSDEFEAKKRELLDRL